MKRPVPIALALLALLAAPAMAGLSPGDRAPAFTGDSFVNTDPVQLSDLQGKVVVYEIFRTW